MIKARRNARPSPQPSLMCPHRRSPSHWTPAFAHVSVSISRPIIDVLDLVLCAYVVLFLVCFYFITVLDIARFRFVAPFLGFDLVRVTDSVLGCALNHVCGLVSGIVLGVVLGLVLVLGLVPTFTSFFLFRATLQEARNSNCKRSCVAHKWAAAMSYMYAHRPLGLLAGSFRKNIHSHSLICLARRQPICYRTLTLTWSSQNRFQFRHIFVPLIDVRNHPK